MSTNSSDDSQIEIVAPFAAKPVLPADFDHDAWDLCQPVKIVDYWSGVQAPPERHAEARLCWSNEALHVRFVCAQREPLVISANPVTHKKTLGLWDRDVCEIFLAPDANNSSRYFEFEAAPSGEWVDLGIQVKPSGRETDWDFSSGMTTASSIETTRVLIGMRIPWGESIPRPWAGALWGVNLFRCVGPEPQLRHLAWRPTKTIEPNFHVPEAFGSLRFE